MRTLQPIYSAPQANLFTARLVPVFAAFITIAGYLYIAIPDCFQQASDCFTSFAVAPFRYRILSILLERLIAPGGLPPQIIVADIAIHTIATLIVYFGLYTWLTRWVDESAASIGILILCGAWMFAYYFYLRTVYTVIEMACIVLALLALKSRLSLYAALVIIASLNRETGVFVALIWIAYHADEWRARRFWINAGMLLLTYGAVTAALHIGIGSAEHMLGLLGTLALNIKRLGDGLFLNAMLLPLWIMTVKGYRYAPPELQRLALVGVLSIVSILVGASWSEMPRLALVVYPLVLPVMVVQLRGNRV